MRRPSVTLAVMRASVCKCHSIRERSDGALCARLKAAMIWGRHLADCSARLPLCVLTRTRFVSAAPRPGRNSRGGIHRVSGSRTPLTTAPGERKITRPVTRRSFSVAISHISIDSSSACSNGTGRVFQRRGSVAGNGQLVTLSANNAAGTKAGNAVRFQRASHAAAKAKRHAVNLVFFASQPDARLSSY